MPGRVWQLALVLSLLACSARADEPYGRHQFEDYEREHWSFVPVVRPAPPDVADAAWPTNEIDRFILAKLERNGLAPAPPADHRTLLRRVYLDLIGLPPTPEEQAAWELDHSPAAYARLVDDLLARPQYGERWARHWLDVVRYAESNGYERDNPKPEAWRYRDWVIESFNRDQPYDQFLIEQIAGDEIEDTNAATQIATTFLRLGPWDDEPADPTVDRYDQLDDVLAGTAAAFMAQTLRCARCHDHKFEPFKQTDYARMLAVFEPLKRPQNDRDDLTRMVGTPDELSAWRAAMSAADDQVAEVRKQIRTLESTLCGRLTAGGTTLPEGLPPEALTAFQVEPEQRDDAQRKLLEEHKDRLAEAFKGVASGDESFQLNQWNEAIAAIDAARPPEPPRAYIWFEEGPTAPTVTRVFLRGDPAYPDREVAPGFPAVLVDAPPEAPAPTAHSTGRRLQLARWLAQPEHPLTARVMVNRIWQHHFGDGIAGTENDFGVMGEAPSHPELLDWLADEFIAGGWTVKRMHRLMLLSSTYRMSAAPHEAAERIDPTNDLLWRFAPRRLEAEAVRDSVLAASGRLNPQAGGPSVFPKIARAVLESQSRPGSGWHESDPIQAARRSVYCFVKRTLPLPELELLDQPSSNETCEQRVVSTVAPQALTYLNGEFLRDQAASFAERLAAEAGGHPAAIVDRAFLLTVCRPPLEEERNACIDFLVRQQAQISADQGPNPPPGAISPARQALVSFCVVMLNNNEFVYLQ
jgi:hypothetical protein